MLLLIVGLLIMIMVCFLACLNLASKEDEYIRGNFDK